MRLLIVEDEEKLAETLAQGLTKKGYAVDTLGDGEKALDRISMHNQDYDLVILDLMLPGMDGQSVCKAVRDLDITVPILILTARNATENKVELLLAGADDYLVKPFSFAELCARIQALLRRPAEMVPTLLRFKDIELNPQDYTVVKGGKPVSLTLKEFSLLEYFMRNQDRVINREELLSHLWDFNYESFSNVIDVHIKNLRRKLGGEEGFDDLETIRGIGYKLSQ